MEIIDYKEHLKLLKKAKQEVFDDLEKMDIDDLCELWITEEYKELKRKHNIK